MWLWVRTHPALKILHKNNISLTDTQNTQYVQPRSPVYQSDTSVCLHLMFWKDISWRLQSTSVEASVCLLGYFYVIIISQLRDWY